MNTCTQLIHPYVQYIASPLPSMVACFCFLMSCVLSPTKHVFHGLGYKTFIFPRCLVVCYHLKTETDLILMASSVFTIIESQWMVWQRSPDTRCWSSCEHRVVWWLSVGSKGEHRWRRMWKVEKRWLHCCPLHSEAEREWNSVFSAEYSNIVCCEGWNWALTLSMQGLTPIMMASPNTFPSLDRAFLAWSLDWYWRCIQFPGDAIC